MNPSRAADELPQEESGEWTEADVTWLRARRGSGVHRVLAPRDVEGARPADEPHVHGRAHGARVLLGLSHNPHKPR